MIYALFEMNEKTSHLFVIEVSSDVTYLSSRCSFLNDFSKRHVKYYVSALDSPRVQDCINKFCIDYVLKVAMCLNLADGCFNKNGRRNVEKAAYFLERARYFAKHGAKYLDN